MNRTRTVIVGVQVSEKGTDLSTRHNQFLLRVAPDANKIEIKAAVQDLFNVTVQNVRTQNYKGKVRVQRNRRRSRAPDWKRAVVTLKAGDRIEMV